MKVAESMSLATPQFTPAGRVWAGPVRFETARSTAAGLAYKLLALFIFLVYLSPGEWTPSVDALHLLRWIGLIALIALVLEKGAAGEALELAAPEGYYLMGFVVAAALSILTALWPRQSVESTLDLTKYALIYVVITNVVTTAPRLNRVVAIMVLGGIVPALGTLKHWSDGVLMEGRAGWIGIFANPNDLAYSLVILVPLAAYLAANSSGLFRLIALAAMGVYLAAIYVTFSRGGMVGLFAVLGLMALRRNSARARFLMALLAAASIFFVFYYWSRAEGFTGLAHDATLQQRIVTIRTGLAMFLDNPLLGVGIGCSGVAWPLYSPEPSASEGWLVTHNTFVQALGETGLIGFVMFCLFLVAGVRRARAVVRATLAAEESWAPGLASALEISLWGFMICGLTGGNVVSWFPYILIGLISATYRLALQQAPNTEAPVTEAAQA